METGRGGLHESSRAFVKKIRALEFVGVPGNAFVFVERSGDRLIKFKVIDSITIMETLHG